MKIIFTNNLITCKDYCVETEKEEIAIVIEGEKITDILPSKEVSGKYIIEEAELIHLEDKYVLPGLIDAHLHLSFSASSQPVTELVNDTEEQILLRMVSAAQTELKSGVTTVRDSGSRGMAILTLRDMINSGMIDGPDIITAGMPITTTGGHCNFCGLECDSVDEVRKATRMLCKSGVDYIKVMVSGGNMTPGSASTITQYDYDALKTIVDEAHTHGKKVSGHVHTVESIENSIRAGFDTLEHCSFKASDGEENYRQDLVDLMKEKNVVLCPAFSKSYVVSAAEGAPQPDKIAMWEAFKTSRFKTTKLMFKSGVKVIAGTDAGCKNTKFDEFWKVIPLLHEEIGMTAQEAILSATLSSAEALGYSDLIGSVEKGKHADIIAISENPLNNLNAFGKVCFVMKRGKIINCYE